MNTNYIKFWGVRGSRPTTEKNKMAYGGDTSCVEIRTKTNEMIILDSMLKVYGFANHKGYGTKEHMMAIDIFGPSVYHRLSFSPLNDRSF